MKSEVGKTEARSKWIPIKQLISVCNWALHHLRGNYVGVALFCAKTEHNPDDMIKVVFTNFRNLLWEPQTRCNCFLSPFSASHNNYAEFHMRNLYRVALNF